MGRLEAARQTKSKFIDVVRADYTFAHYVGRARSERKERRERERERL